MVAICNENLPWLLIYISPLLFRTSTRSTTIIWHSYCEFFFFVLSVLMFPGKQTFLVMWKDFQFTFVAISQLVINVYFQLTKTAKNFQDKGRSQRSLYLFGHGDGGQGPTQDILENLERLKDVDGLPRWVRMLVVYLAFWLWERAWLHLRECSLVLCVIDFEVQQPWILDRMLVCAYGFPKLGIVRSAIWNCLTGLELTWMYLCVWVGRVGRVAVAR